MPVVQRHFKFENGNFEFIAIVTHDNKVYWKLTPFAVLFGYFEPHRACKLINEKFKFKWSQLSESYPECGHWHPNTIFVSEPGIYSLIYRSRSHLTKKFMNQVIDVVLPSIQVNGTQATDALQQSLSEKDRLLTETREVLTARERALLEIQMRLANRERILVETEAALEEKNRTLAETRAALEEKDRMLAETRAALEETDRMLAETRAALEENNRTSHQLQNDVQSKVRPSVRHTLCVYQHENTYKFIRTQKRNLKKAVRGIPSNFKLVYLVDDVANPFHIVNRLKEMLPLCKVKLNTITTDADVLALLEKCM